MNNEIYISIDGNGVGKIIEEKILSDNLLPLKEISQKITLQIQYLTEWIEKHGGIVYLSGGDNILAYIHIQYLDELINKIYYFKDVAFSIGLGNNPKDAYLALKYAKVSHAFLPVLYNDNRFTFYKLNK